MKKPIDYIMDCPGAWYGTSSDSMVPYPGHVAVDPKRALDALVWLNRRVKVLGTDTLPDGAFLIRYKTREQYKLDQATSAAIDMNVALSLQGQ